MSEIVIPNHSPLAERKGELRGVYFDRIAAEAEKIINCKLTQEEDLRKLAFIAAKLPSDYDWVHRTAFFSNIEDFLETLEDYQKIYFKETFLVYEKGALAIDFFLPDHKTLVKKSEVTEKNT
jgi:hypothetical protein